MYLGDNFDRARSVSGMFAKVTLGGFEVPIRCSAENSFLLVPRTRERSPTPRLGGGSSAHRVVRIGLHRLLYGVDFGRHQPAESCVRVSAWRLDSSDAPG